MGMSVDHRLDGITKLLRVELSIQHEAQLHRVHVVAAPCGTGVVEQPLLQRSQQEQIGEVMLPRQFIDLPLIQHGGAMSDGVNPPPPLRTCAQIPVRA